MGFLFNMYLLVGALLFVWVTNNENSAILALKLWQIVIAAILVLTIWPYYLANALRARG